METRFQTNIRMLVTSFLAKQFVVKLSTLMDFVHGQRFQTQCFRLHQLSHELLVSIKSKSALFIEMDEVIAKVLPFILQPNMERNELPSIQRLGQLLDSSEREKQYKK